MALATPAKNYDYANEIHRQFGRAFRAMMGAKQGIIVDETTVRYRLGMRAPTRAQFVEITYDVGLDMYHVSTFKMNRNYERVTVLDEGPIYVDQVARAVERGTGLCLTL